MAYCLRCGALLKGERFEHALSRVSGLPRVLRVGVLPFEQYQAVESNRLANCKGAFAFEDTKDGQIKFVPTCTWFRFRQKVLKSITAKYGIASKAASKQPKTIKDANTQSPDEEGLRPSR